MAPEISYLVVSYNSEKYILKCITSILNQSHTNYEIIVIDNNSQDGTVSIVTDLCTKNEKIRLIANKENIGYVSAITKGIENTHSEFLAILNADAFLDKDWARKILYAFQTDQKVMSASGTIYFPNGELQSSGGMMDKYCAVVQRGSKIFYSRNIGDKSFFYNDGSSFMVRRKIFQDINLDPRLFLYYEDVDLSWKIRMMDYKVIYIPEAISYHDLGHSFYNMTLLKFYYITRNRIYVCQKNYSLRNIICRFPIMLFLIFLSSIFYDVRKKPHGYTGTFFKAAFWNMVNISSILKERKKLRLMNKISDSELDHYLIQGSIELPLIKGGT